MSMRRNDITINEVSEPMIEESSKTPAVDGGSKRSRKSKIGKVIRSRYVQVRKVPSTNSQVVTVMNLGEEGEILDRVPGYYKIKTKDGNVGYVASTYFEVV